MQQVYVGNLKRFVRKKMNTAALIFYNKGDYIVNLNEYAVTINREVTAIVWAEL